MDLDASILQSEFASLVGVSEQRVSQLVSEGLLAKGETGREWLLAYCTHLRDRASGRTSEASLTAARTDLASSKAEEARMALEAKRGTLIPAAVLEKALFGYCRQASAAWDSLVQRFLQRHPDAPREMVRTLEQITGDARALAASVTTDGVDLGLDDDEDDAEEANS